jgi:transposase
MVEVVTVGLDIAKSVFQVHSVDVGGGVAIVRRLRRAQVLPFFAKIPACLIGIEACATAHYWAREIGALGHQVKLIPPSYVKPYVKQQKNDAADAAAICEAVTRPTMRFVEVKSPAHSPASFDSRDGQCHRTIWPRSICGCGMKSARSHVSKVSTLIISISAAVFRSTKTR